MGTWHRIGLAHDSPARRRHAFARVYPLGGHALGLEPLECRQLLAATVGVRFEFDNSVGAAVSSLTVGQDYVLKAFIQDARDPNPVPPGVRQAYFNIAFDAGVASVNGAITHGADFNQNTDGTSSAGTLTAVGGSDTDGVPPAANAEELLFSVPLHISAAGSLTLTPTLPSASTNPLEQVETFDSAATVPLENIAFTLNGGPTLTIAAASGPSVQSIDRVNSNPTNAATVQYTVTFSSNVTGVDTTDFQPIATGAVSGATIAGVAIVSGSVYTVTVNTGTGDGTLALKVADDDSIKDASNQPLGGTGTGNGDFTGTPPYDIDKTAPTVVLPIALTGPTTTNSSTVQFTVTFDGPVTTPAAADFTPVTTGGITGASIANVASAGGNAYTVTVNTGTGDGTLALRIPAAGTIKDSAGNALSGTFPVTSSAFTIDKTSPTVVLPIALTDPTTNNLSAVHYTVTFDGPVTGVGTSDFDVQTTGTLTGASVASVTPSTGNSFTVTVNTGTGDGTLTLRIPNAGTIVDSAGNPLGGTFPIAAPPYTIDRTPPDFVPPIALTDPTTTNLATVHFTVNFNEPVVLDANDFTVVTTGAIFLAAVTSVTPATGNSYTVAVSTGHGDGTLALQIPATATITDTAGNPLANELPITSSAYTIDKTGPAVLLPIDLTDPTTTNLATVHFTVTFDGAVTGVANNSFSVVTTGSISGASVASVTPGSGNSFTVVVNTGTGDGTIALGIPSAGTIADSLGNPLTGTFPITSAAYTIDKTAPAVAILSVSKPILDATPTAAVSGTGEIGATVSVTATDGTTTTTPARTATVGTDGNWLITDFDVSSLSDGVVRFDAKASDTLGNQSQTVSITSVKGTYSLSAQNVTDANAASLNPYPFSITFSSALFTALQAGGFTVQVLPPLAGAPITATQVGDPVNNTDSTVTVNFTITPPNNNWLQAQNGDYGVALNDTGNSLSTSLGTFNVAHAVTATKLAVTSQPTTVQAGGPFSLSVSIEDNNGIVDTSSSASVTIALLNNPGGSTLGGGALTVNAVNGVATFSGLTLNKIGTGYTIRATSLGFASADTAGFDVTPGAVSQLVITTQPPTSVSPGQPFTVSVSAEDAQNNLVASFTSSVSLALVNNPGGSTLGGASPVNAVGGVATFSGLTLNNVGSGYTLQATSGSLTSPPSSPLNVTSTTASLSITSQPPATVQVNTPFSLTVSALTSTGGVDTSFNGSVTIALTNNPGSSTLGGTLTVSAVNGVATFSGLTLNNVGTGYVITATSGSLNVATNSFNASLDTTPPTVQSISLVESPTTNASTVHFTVKFSESVTGVDATDFQVVKPGEGNSIAGESITSVTGGGDTWTVTVSDITGNGLLGLNLIDDNSIKDTAGNSLGGPTAGDGNFTTGQQYTIDQTVPGANSITPNAPNPTSASTATFEVRFTEAVTGVDLSDFVLTPSSGITGASIASVTGGTDDWTVTVNTGSGSGTLTLRLVDDNSIKDTAGNPLGGPTAGDGSITGSPPLTVDKTNPTVVSINTADANPSSATQVHFTVTFSETVTGVDATDFAVVPGGGLSGASIAGVSGTGSVYTVTVNTGVGAGTVGLNLVDNDSILDSANTPLGGTGTGNGNFTGQVYTITRSGNISGFVYLDRNGDGKRDSGEPGLGGVLVTLNGTDTNLNRFPSQTVTTADDGSYSFSNLGDGTYDLTEAQPGNLGNGSSSAPSNGTGGPGNTITNIHIAGGNSAADNDFGDTLSQVVSINMFLASTPSASQFLSTLVSAAPTVGPRITSITRLDANPTTAATARFQVNFNYPVTGVDASDFFVEPGSSSSGGSVTGVSGSGQVYIVAASTGTTSGRLQLALNDDDSIVDGSGTPLGGPGALPFFSDVYTVNKSSPLSTPAAAPASALVDQAMLDNLGDPNPPDGST